MGWWKNANEKADKIVDEEVDQKRDAGKAGRN